ATRRGFTLVEVIVTMLILAALAAVTYPTIKARLTDGYENSLINELDNLASAVMSYRENVGHYPRRLDYLTSLQTGSTDICGNTLSAAESSGYRGPYITRNLLNTTTFYIFGNKDTISDTLRRVTGALVGTTGDYLAIVVRGPDTTSAIDIDLKVDGVKDSSNGAIRWTQGTDSLHSLRFAIPIKSGAC
ncbi:MAG TPA: type II secretion system protein, partial [Chloroflexota bacterium]|nr:type II secretion system protein [Chloroflexota bacterium]